jgi:hypothetical protein
MVWQGNRLNHNPSPFHWKCTAGSQVSENTGKRPIFLLKRDLNSLQGAFSTNHIFGVFFPSRCEKISLEYMYLSGLGRTFGRLGEFGESEQFKGARTGISFWKIKKGFENCLIIPYEGVNIPWNK